MNFKPGQRVKHVPSGQAGRLSRYITGSERTDCQVELDGPWKNIFGETRPQSELAYAESSDLVPLSEPGQKEMTHDEVRQLGAGLLSEIVKPGEIVEHGDVERAHA